MFDTVKLLGEQNKLLAQQLQVLERIAAALEQTRPAAEVTISGPTTFDVQEPLVQRKRKG